MKNRSRNASAAKKKSKAAAGALPDIRRILKRTLTAAVAAVWLLTFVLVKLGVVTENQILVFFDLADKPASNADMSVHFVDVGQGDCELVLCDGKAALIDCGERDMGRRVCSYLKAQNVTRLDYFIISHQHTDHMGCASDVLKSFDVGCIIMPPVPDELVPTNSCYSEFLDAVSECQTELYLAPQNSCETLTLGSCTLDIYAQGSDSGVYESLNDYSLCVRAEHGDNTFLFVGDAEEAEEAALLESGIELSAKVLKVSHHGSSSSSSYEFLKAVGARYAVIEVGAGNSYGHPQSEAVSRIEKYCEYIYRTDIDGTVVFESDGVGLNILVKDKSA